MLLNGTAQIGETALPFSQYALLHCMQVSVQLQVPAALLTKKGPGAHWITDWTGLRTSLDAVEKRKTFCPLSGIERQLLVRPAGSLTA
jgi:hypothetical protein